MKYDEISFFSEGLSIVKIDDKYGFIDTIGREVIPIKYDRVTSFIKGKDNNTSLAISSAKVSIKSYFF